MHKDPSWCSKSKARLRLPSLHPQPSPSDDAKRRSLCVPRHASSRRVLSCRLQVASLSAVLKRGMVDHSLGSGILCSEFMPRLTVRPLVSHAHMPIAQSHNARDPQWHLGPWRGLSHRLGQQGTRRDMRRDEGPRGRGEGSGVNENKRRTLAARGQRSAVGDTCGADWFPEINN